jgi:hypothetical protein
LHHQKLSLLNDVCMYVYRICTIEEISFGVFTALIVHIVATYKLVQRQNPEDYNMNKFVKILNLESNSK